MGGEGEPKEMKVDEDLVLLGREITWFAFEDFFLLSSSSMYVIIYIDTVLGKYTEMGFLILVEKRG